MSDIVHSHVEHVEKKKSFARQYNVMQISLHGGFNGKPSTLLQIVIQRKISVLRRIQTPLTTPIYPQGFALPWHDDVSHIMHMLPCSIYFWHHICHLLSLDMFCRHLFSFYIIYGNYAVSCLLASHNICEMCNAILFNQASYIWMISCPSFSSLHFHLSTMFVH